MVVALPVGAALDLVPDAEPDVLAAALPLAEVVSLSVLISIQLNNERRMLNSHSGSTTSARRAIGPGSGLRVGTNRSPGLRHSAVDAARAGAGGDGLQIRECGGTCAILENGRAGMGCKSWSAEAKLLCAHKEVPRARSTVQV